MTTTTVAVVVTAIVTVEQGEKVFNYGGQSPECSKFDPNDEIAEFHMKEGRIY